MSTEITVPQPASLERTAPRSLAFVLGFFFSFRYSIVLLSVRLFALEPSTGSVLSLVLDFTIFCLICFDSVGGQLRSLPSMLRLPAIRWVVIFLAFSCLSLIWTESASLPDSAAYWLGLFIDVASVLWLLRRGSGQEDGVAMMRGFIWSSCVLALTAWIMPIQPDLRLGDEQYFNTNEIANLCALAFFLAQYLARRNQEHWRFAQVLLVITLVRSLSKSTLIAFLVSETFLLIQDRSMSRKTKVMLTTCAFLVILVFWGLFEAYYDVYTTAGNQAETLSGRTAIWLYVVDAVFDHPWNLWIGHGFDSWWKVVPPFGNEMFEARHAENEILQQFYAYGVVGIMLLLGIYGSLMRQFLKLEQNPAQILLISVVVFVAVRGLAVADGFDLLLPLWSIVLISTVANCSLTVASGHTSVCCE